MYPFTNRSDDAIDGTKTISTTLQKLKGRQELCYRPVDCSQKAVLSFAIFNTVTAPVRLTLASITSKLNDSATGSGAIYSNWRYTLILL